MNTNKHPDKFVNRHIGPKTKKLSNMNNMGFTNVPGRNKLFFIRFKSISSTGGKAEIASNIF